MIKNFIENINVINVLNITKIIQNLNENKFWNSSYSNNKKSSSNIKWLNINKNNKLIILSFLGAIPQF